jgi:hypothetical protein
VLALRADPVGSAAIDPAYRRCGALGVGVGIGVELDLIVRLLRLARSASASASASNWTDGPTSSASN